MASPGLPLRDVGLGPCLAFDLVMVTAFMLCPELSMQGIDDCVNYGYVYASYYAGLWCLSFSQAELISIEG